MTHGPIPRIGSFLSIKDTIDYEDPISLAPIYCAFKISESVNVHSFPFIDLFQKIASTDQLNTISLSAEHVDPQLNPHISLENKLSDIKIRVAYISGGIFPRIFFFFRLLFFIPRNNRLSSENIIIKIIFFLIIRN